MKLAHDYIKSNVNNEHVFFRYGSGVWAEELFWFIRGWTSSKELQEKNVKIWDGNSSRAFLVSVGLNHREEEDLGPVLVPGFQVLVHCNVLDSHRG